MMLKNIQFPMVIDLFQEEFDLIRNLVFEKSGINLQQGKMELVRTRLGSRLRELKFESYMEYYEYVRDDKTGTELVAMLDSISTNLTSFFREQGHFDFLKNALVPEMLARKKKLREKESRVWSAGCSSGEEPYSLAFTLSELLRGTEVTTLKILATDLSTQVLKHATLGVYGETQVQSIPPAILKRYLTKESEKGVDRYTISEKIRKLIQFKRFNLMSAQFPFKRKFDFIFCRNVMIYFDKPTQEALVAKYYDILAPGGYLFIGHSESLTGIMHQFKYVLPTTYKKPE